MPKALPEHAASLPMEDATGEVVALERDNGVLLLGGGVGDWSSQGTVVKQGFLSIQERYPGPHLFLLSK